MIRFENGAVLQVEAAFSLNLKEDTGSVQIFGTKGGARLAPGLELYSELQRLYDGRNARLPARVV